MELDDSGHVRNVYPEATGDWSVAHMPEGVASQWREAVKVFKVGAFASAVVACGRTLEAAADARQVPRGTLFERVQQMRSDGLITDEFKEAMDYARLIRNIGAHAGKEVSRETAEGTMRFTEQALRLLFEVPGELGRLTGHPPELVDDEDEAGAVQAPPPVET